MNVSASIKSSFQPFAPVMLKGVAEDGPAVLVAATDADLEIPSDLSGTRSPRGGSGADSMSWLGETV